MTPTRRRHRPRTSIIVTTLFSLFYFVSVFTSKIDILLPSYLKSASESVHQLYGASEALSYLEYIEELAHPAAYLLEYIMSRAASDSGDVSGVLGGRPQPPSPPTSVHASPSPAPQSPMGPLDLLNKPDIIKSVAEFHIKRDASYIAPPSLDIKDIYNLFNETIWNTADLTLNDHILRYFRSCPTSRSDYKIGYIVLTEPEYKHLWDNDRIKMTNVDIAMAQGYPNLYQHIHIHQQATDAINFKITSCILVVSNDKIDVNWKRDYLGHRLYLIAINIAVDEPRTRNILRPYRRDSSQHQEFELNQPASTPPLHVPSIGNVLVILCRTTSQDIYDKVNHPGIVSSHVFDQTAISGPLNSHAHSLISLCAHDTIWSKAHLHIQMYFPHMMNIIKTQNLFIKPPNAPVDFFRNSSPSRYRSLSLSLPLSLSLSLEQIIYVVPLPLSNAKKVVFANCTLLQYISYFLLRLCYITALLPNGPANIFQRIPLSPFPHTLTNNSCFVLDVMQ